jgi:hypothetical protein
LPRRRRCASSARSGGEKRPAQLARSFSRYRSGCSGSALDAAFCTFELTGVFVWTALLVALRYALNGVVTLIECRLLRWRPGARPA